MTDTATARPTPRATVSELPDDVDDCSEDEVEGLPPVSAAVPTTNTQVGPLKAGVYKAT